jgi:ABC-type nitrate/sulfonate/bicarbonate transport system ATPase subunit
MTGAALDVRIDAKSVREPGGELRPILLDVCFSAEPGEFLALFGPSGTGKSTTLRIALGLDADFRGVVRRADARVGVVFQEPRLLPWLTIADNLRLVMNDGSRAADISGLLQQVELPGIEQRRPRELSLGMARRVALARALAADPQLLVLDEPFASLDPALAARLAGTLSRWAQRRGATVLLATHDVDQTLDIAGRVLVLDGSPATLAASFDVPQHTDPNSVAELRTRLVERFPFLTRAEAAS